MNTNPETYHYKWLLLACSSLANFFVWGMFYSVGIYYVKWVEYFGASKGDIAIVGSLPPGTGSFLAPVFGACIHRFGFRSVGIVGGLLVAGGLILSTFSTHLIYLGIFYGAFGGIGAGFCHLASAVGLNYYFDKKHRSFAEGITSMGVGCGTFVFNVFFQYLLDNYDWRGALLLTGAIALHLVVVFQLMLPPTYLRRFHVLEKWRSKDNAVSIIEEKLADEAERDRDSLLDAKLKGEQDGPLCVIDKKVDDILNSEDNYRSAQPQDITEDVEADISAAKTESWLMQTKAVYKKPIFLLFLTSDFLCWLCVMIPYVHLPERCRLLGMDPKTAAWVSSTMGITGIIGRPAICSLPNVAKINVVDLYAFVNVLLGVASALSPFFPTTVGLFVYSGVYGFLSVSVPLGRASAAFLMGQKYFPTAYSWMLLFEGIGIYLGPPIAGWIYDCTLFYDNSFYFMGATFIFSGLLLFLRKTFTCTRRRLRRKSSAMPILQAKA